MSQPPPTSWSRYDRLQARLSHVARRQLNRVRTFTCRQALKRNPTKLVDYCALRQILANTTDSELAFLVRALGPTQVDLNQPRLDEPSIFAHMLWNLTLTDRWPTEFEREVEFQAGASSFKMKLDMTRAPECTYYVEDPTPALTRLLRLGGHCFYDVGANVGIHALTASLFFKETHAFEPTPETLDRLRRNLSLNPGSNVSVHEIALSSRAGEVVFSVDLTHPGINRIVETQPGETRAIRVSANTLDAYRASNRLPAPDLVKLDVEGHEQDVLRGAAETVRESRPGLFVEFHDVEKFRRFRALLPDGYESFLLGATGLAQSIGRGAPYPGDGNDILFLPRERLELLDRLAAPRGA